MGIVASPFSTSPELVPTPPPAPTPPPCDPKLPNTTAPTGFQQAEDQGWWMNFTRASLGGSGTVEECSQKCLTFGAQCVGFHVWKPCAVGDCYVYLDDVTGFQAHSGSYAYMRALGPSALLV